MKKIIIFSLLCCLFLPGCWDLTEVEQMGLVTVIGLDVAENNNIRIYISEINPQVEAGQTGGGGGAKSRSPSHLHIVTGETVFDAIRRLSMEASHRIFFAHTQVIIFSEELARARGIRPFIDFFERDAELRRSVWLLIAQKGQLEKIIYTDTPLNTSKGQVLDRIIVMGQRNSFFAVNRLGDFIELFGETGNEAYTAGVTLTAHSPWEDQVSGGKESEKPKIMNVNVQDTAVFRGDKLTGWLNDKESRGLLWVEGKVKGGIITTSFEGKRLSFEILRAESEVKPVVADGKMKINIKVKVDSNIGESQGDLDFSKKKVIEMVQQLQAEEVKREITRALDKSRQLESDVFGFGRYFYAMYPEQWRQVKDSWYEYYPDLEVNVAVDSTISRIGLISRPVQKLKEAEK